MTQSISSFFKNQRIVLPENTGFRFCVVEDLLYFESQNTCSMVFLEDGTKFLCLLSLKELELLLPYPNFFRIHRGYIVNVRKVRRYKNANGGRVELDGPISLPIARLRKAQFTETINS